jgi:hypothetical protein
VGSRAGIAAVLVAVAASGWVLASDSLEPETPDQPEAIVGARENPLARSPGRRVATGPYVSVQVNVDSHGENIVGDAANEPSIAVNPANPANMVIGWRQFNAVTSNFRQGGWAYTVNGGANWTFPGVLTPGTFRSDPVIDVDAAGVFYYQSLKGNFLMDVFKSTDGGKTWGAPIPSFGGDKNWMAIDRTGGIGDGNVYGIWQRFASCCGTSVFTRSTDGAASFLTPVPVGYWPTFGTLAVGPDGTVFAAGIDGTNGQDFAQFVVARSSNARDPGQFPSFAGMPVVLGGSMGISLGPNPVGLLGQGNVAADASTGGTRGNVYVLASVIPDLGHDPLDVYFIRSADGGQTWTAPRRVNDDASEANWQWLGAHGVSPNGRIDAIWFDTRDSGVNHVSRLYYAYSWDGGDTWSPNVAVSPSFDSWVGFPQQNKMGDYITLVSNDTGADVAYAATFNGEQDVYYVRLFPDCNGNAVSDVVDLATHAAQDCDLDRVPDTCQAAPQCIGAGAVPEDAAAGGTPLTVDRGPDGVLNLGWGASCAGDADYAVYSGTLGGFASHVPVTCTTAGLASWSLAAPDGSAYYLVVPVHADREGSYGDASGSERPPSADACAPQAVRACGR